MVKGISQPLKGYWKTRDYTYWTPAKGEPAHSRRFARRLRLSATKAEKHLLKRMIERTGFKRHGLGYKFAGQHFDFQYAFDRRHRAAKDNHWIADFFFPGSQLAIEVDGPYHQTSRMATKDLARDKVLANIGVRVLRVTNKEVIQNTDAVIGRILRTLLVPKDKRLPQIPEADDVAAG